MLFDYNVLRRNRGRNRAPGNPTLKHGLIRVGDKKRLRPFSLITHGPLLSGPAITRLQWRRCGLIAIAPPSGGSLDFGGLNRRPFVQQVGKIRRRCNPGVRRATPDRDRILGQRSATGNWTSRNLQFRHAVIGPVRPPLAVETAGATGPSRALGNGLYCRDVSECPLLPSNHPSRVRSWFEGLAPARRYTHPETQRRAGGRASISSMKTRCRAHFSWPARRRITDAAGAATDEHFNELDPENREEKGTPACPGRGFGGRVLPVPGGPTNNTLWELGRNSCEADRGFLRKSTDPREFELGASCRPTSPKVTWVWAPI